MLRDTTLGYHAHQVSADAPGAVLCPLAGSLKNWTRALLSDKASVSGAAPGRLSGMLMIFGPLSVSLQREENAGWKLSEGTGLPQ